MNIEPEKLSVKKRTEKSEVEKLKMHVWMDELMDAPMNRRKVSLNVLQAWWAARLYLASCPPSYVFVSVFIKKFKTAVQDRVTSPSERGFLVKIGEGFHNNVIKRETFHALTLTALMSK